MDWLGTAPYWPWATAELAKRARREVVRIDLKYIVMYGLGFMGLMGGWWRPGRAVGFCIWLEFSDLL